MTSLPIPILIKGVTMDHFFLKIKGILLNKSLEIHKDDKNEIFEETPETKKMRHKTIKYLFLKKSSFGGKNFISCAPQFFIIKTYFFSKIFSFEHFNVLWRIMFV